MTNTSYSSYALSLVLGLALVVSSCLALLDSQCKSLVNFNSGLTPRINYYKDRRLAIPEKLLAQDADVVCLQEYWFEQDMQQLLSHVGSTYPYHYSLLHKEIGTLADPKDPDVPPKRACTEADVKYFQSDLVPCVAANGCLAKMQASTEEGLECVTSKCAKVLKAPNFTPECFSCTTMSATNLTNAFDWCGPEAEGENNRFNAPGLVVLSKQPIKSAQYHSYEPDHRMNLQRGFIEADIEDFGTLACTHLTSVFGRYFEYDLPYSSYMEQQLNEEHTLDANFAGRDHIVAGDLNMGPEVENPDQNKDLDGEAPENFEEILAKGYTTTYLEDDGRCTFCHGINELSLTPQRKAIDYALLKGDQYSYQKSERVLDDLSPFPLSDHFGIKTTLCT